MEWNSGLAAVQAGAAGLSDGAAAPALPPSDAGDGAPGLPGAAAPPAGAAAPDDLFERLRDQLADHAGLIQETLQVLLEQRDLALLTELASLREHSHDLHAALNAQRADQQFTRQMVEQCLQNAIAQRDAALRATVADLSAQQAAAQQALESVLQDHLAAWRGEVGELHRRLDEAVASETAHREAAVAALREQVAVLREELAVVREYQHDRDLRTEALLRELTAGAAFAAGGAGWWARLRGAVQECYWRIRGR